MTPSPSQLPRPARGTLLTRNAMGFAFSNPHLAESFLHPWMPFLLGGELRLRLGLVEGYVPKIGGVPMTGKTGQLPPTLKLTGASKATRESWAVLLVTPNSEGVVDAQSRLEIVHSLTMGAVPGDTGQCKIALIVWSAAKPVMVVPAVHFNLRYAQSESNGQIIHRIY